MVEVTVRGAGAFGLSIAWECVRRGAKVRVVDPNGIGAGASGGIVGALAPHVPEQWNEKKAFQLESLLMAEDFWAGVEKASGLTSGYARIGRWQPIGDNTALSMAMSRGAGAMRFWGDEARWRVIDRPDDPWAPASPTGKLIHDTLSARLHPALSCRSLAAAILDRGGEVVAEAPDRGAVIWATGWQGLEELTAGNGRMVGVGVKGQAVLVGYDARTCPQLFVDGLHIVPHADGTVAIGSTTEREFDDPTETDAQCDTLLERAIDAIPALAKAPVLRRWAGVRPRSRTRAPMLGTHPFRPGEFIANGGFKIGFGMAPLAARVMADLVLEGIDVIPADFDPAANL